MTRLAPSVYRLDLGGKPTKLIVRGAVGVPGVTAARSHTGLLYGTLFVGLPSSNPNLYRGKGIVFVRDARGLHTFDDRIADQERDGRVLLIDPLGKNWNGDMKSPANASLYDRGELRTIGPFREATLRRDGSITGWTLVRRNGTPYLGEANPLPAGVRRVPFVWRNGMRR